MQHDPSEPPTLARLVHAVLCAAVRGSAFSLCVCVLCVQVLDLSCNTTLCSLGSGFSSLSSLTELNLAGPNCLFKDPVHHSSPANHTAGSNVISFAAVAGLSQNTPAGDAADASAPLLSHEQQLQVLPQLAQLTNLRELSLAHNRDMLVLPASVCGLTQLEVLDVRSCSLRYLNDELWDCGGLRELLLGDNVLDALPDDIGRLQKLEVRVWALSVGWFGVEVFSYAFTAGRYSLFCSCCPALLLCCLRRVAAMPDGFERIAAQPGAAVVLLCVLPCGHVAGAGHWALPLPVAAAFVAAVPTTPAAPGAGHQGGGAACGGAPGAAVAQPCGG